MEFNPDSGNTHASVPDELRLRGRLQIATARDALVSAGINPGTQEALSTLLDVHEALSDDSDQNDMHMYIKGDGVGGARADIIMSLELMAENSAATPSSREAALGLLELLR